MALGNSAKQMLPRTSMELKFQKQMLPASPRAQTMDLKFRASYQIEANLLFAQNAVCCANHYKGRGKKNRFLAVQDSSIGDLVTQ